VNRVSIPINDIQMDGGTQPRAVLDFNAIDDYADAMSAGDEFPAVTVFYDGERYWLADGFHRVRAADAANFETVECDVRQGTIEDAQWYSFSANHTNGLRRTNDDKQRAVKSAITHANGAGLSNRQIADHVGVDESTVRVWREKLTAGIPQSTRRTGRDGRTISVSKIGRAPAQVPQTDAAPPSAASAHPEASNSISPPSGRTARSQRIDRLARLTLSFIEATKHLAHLVGWLGETAGEFDQAELLLSNATTAVAAVSAEIEQMAVAADPLNRDRLGIQEK